MVKMTQPLGGLFENVIRIDFAGDGEKSPLNVLMEELNNGGYVAEAIQIDLASFHQARRPRP